MLSGMVCLADFVVQPVAVQIFLVDVLAVHTG